jgi:hypothetical protein
MQAKSTGIFMYGHKLAFLLFFRPISRFSPCFCPVPAEAASGAKLGHGWHER